MLHAVSHVTCMLHAMSCACRMDACGGDLKEKLLKLFEMLYMSARVRCTYCVYTYTCMYIHMYVCMYMLCVTHVCMYVHVMCVCMQHTHVRMYVYMYVCA